MTAVVLGLNSNVLGLARTVAKDSSLDAIELPFEPSTPRSSPTRRGHAAPHTGLVDGALEAPFWIAAACTGYGLEPLDECVNTLTKTCRVASHALVRVRSLSRTVPTPFAFIGTEEYRNC